MKQIVRFNAALDRGLSKSIFDHVRNYMMCSLLLAIGFTEFEGESELLFDLVPANYSSISLVALSCILFSLNLYDGIREISKSQYHTIYTIGLVLIYVAMSVVVIELASSFRASL